MSKQEVRWIQRFNHFRRAFSQLKEGVDLAERRPLSRLEEQGLIQAFEFTHELAWNTLRDFLEDRGAQNLYGSKDVTREAFKKGLIENGGAWMEMIQGRNLTSHTYNETTATQMVLSVRRTYFAEFEALRVKLERLKTEEER